MFYYRLNEKSNNEKDSYIDDTYKKIGMLVLYNIILNNNIISITKYDKKLVINKPKLNTKYKKIKIIMVHGENEKRVIIEFDKCIKKIKYYLLYLYKMLKFNCNKFSITFIDLTNNKTMLIM